FHFHRIFKSLMGETLQHFVKRHRLQRALQLMSHGRKRSLTDIALRCGFASSSDFSRSFKASYGVAPSAFDLEAFRETKRTELETTMLQHEGGPHLPRLPKGENPDGFEVEFRDLPARHVAYIRVLDPYQSNGVVEACKRLMAWATDRGLEGGQWLGYMWEDPEVVPLKDCRYDVAVVVPEPITDGEVGSFQFPAMHVAQVHLSGSIELEMRALDWIYGTWLPQSGYEPDQQPAFEAWNGLPFAHGMEHFELSCQLPVRKI
ncbi:MAG: GyrI-like domain-containing protein, partial [Planctomycetota bacterium]|nr:GyrI-like domain-containing protein [Planctomycetota bacterium]